MNLNYIVALMNYKREGIKADTTEV